MNIISKKIFSLILLICLSPLFFIVALAIILDDGFPVFFQQRRIGIKNDEFWIYKFRTMKQNIPDIPTHLVKEAKHFDTFIGRGLRKLSIDELPQLINIFKGEMGFIGPRPALYNQDDLIKLRTKAGVHTLIPGITGWAQVNGRDKISIPQKVKLDEYYLHHKSFYLNVKIIFMTALQIIFSKGISN